MGPNIPKIGMLVLFSLLVALSSGQQSGEGFQVPIGSESKGNVTTDIISVTQNNPPYYSMAVVSPDQPLIALIPTSVDKLSRIECIPPQNRQCDCFITPENPGEFRCQFPIPVEGEYSLNLESDEYKAYGNFTLSLIRGEAPHLEQVVRQETITSSALLFAISFAVISVVAYLAYFAYKIANRKRDAMNSLYDQRKKLEDDLKVLRYRFFKREIDATTYNSLFKQKEQELSELNELILKSMKPQKGAKAENQTN